MKHLVTREAAAKSRIVRVLSKALPDDTMADVLNCLLCVEALPQLTDREADAGQWLFDELATANPNAVAIATS